MSAESDPVVVDLGAVGRASVALARWYQGLVATGEADVDELGQARAELAALPVQPGRLGRAVQLVVAGGDDASDEEIVAAVSLLCDAAARAAHAAPTTRPAQVPRPSPPARRRRRVIQPTLPGLDPGEPPGPAGPGLSGRRAPRSAMTAPALGRWVHAVDHAMSPTARRASRTSGPPVSALAPMAGSCALPPPAAGEPQAPPAQ